MHVIHKWFGTYLKDAVYAANDGIVTTFAVVASVTGASLDPVVILILGFANLLADGFSMASGNYLGTKSESDQYHHQRAHEESVFGAAPQQAQEQVMQSLEVRGYTNNEASQISNLVVKNKKFFLDFILFERFGLTPSSTTEALKGALVTFISFAAAGLIPLLPYVFLNTFHLANPFFWASFLMAGALFFVGAIRTLFSDQHWWFGGLEMLLVGGTAATIAYGIGAVLKGIVGAII